jgi:hypothetical protein
MIQLVLAAFGAAGMVEAGAEALKHAGKWLTIAWTAKGNDETIAAASVEFLKMLVSIAIAALSYTGAKANYGNALKIAQSMPAPALPAFAMSSGQRAAGGGAATGVTLGPTTTSMGVAGNAMMQADDANGTSEAQPVDPAKELEEVKRKLEAPEKLSGKEKKALRVRKKELQEQLGVTEAEPAAADVPTPTTFKQRASGLTGKEAATDIPSWAKNWPDARPGVEESGTTFATRMMNKKYGVGGWERTGQQGTEFSELKKFGDRAFE